MELFPRVTLRCIREDLKIDVPEDFISNLEHPILKRLSQNWADTISGNSLILPLERIKCIDDNTFLKCKSGILWKDIPWRGAVWQDPKHNRQPWIVSLGYRKKGSLGDFYESLKIVAQKDLKESRLENPGIKKSYTTDSDRFLPQEEDYQRLATELDSLEKLKDILILQEAVKNAASSFEAIKTVNVFGCQVKVIVFSNHDHEIYLSIKILDYKDPHALSHILQHAVSELNIDDWFVTDPKDVKFIVENNANYFDALLEPSWGRLLKTEEKIISSLG